MSAESSAPISAPISAQQQPLVSVICRSSGRAELEQALQSVAAQTYPKLEIVLVDALAKGPGEAASWCGDVTLVQVADGQKRKRSQAANAGLDAATGEYLLLLDDDDWIAPTHIENLVRRLQSENTIKAAYSNTRKTNRTGVPIDYVFDSEFDPILLMRDNYIPIHAMLFHRSLLQHCRFDEAFDIYEDWDFWLQLNQHTSFAHVDAITAFYREGGESATASADTRVRYQNDSLLGQGRAALFTKWMPRWSGAQLNQLIGILDQSQTLQLLAAELHAERVNLNAANSERHTLATANSRLQGELDHKNRHIESQESDIANLRLHINNLERNIANLQLHADNQDRSITSLQQHADSQKRHIVELTTALQKIHTSFSWKLMGPFRRARRHLQAVFNRGKQQDS